MNTIQLLIDLGDLYYQANAMTSALDVYNKAVQKGARSPELLNNMAGANISLGNFSAAIENYQVIAGQIKSQEERAVVFTRIGDCYRRLGSYSEAILSFRAAIEIQPGNPVLWSGLAQLQQEIERLLENTEAAGLSLTTDSLPEEETNLHADAISEGQQSAVIPRVIQNFSPGEYQKLPDVISMHGLSHGEVSPAIENGGARAILLLTLGLTQYRNGNLDEADQALQDAVSTSVNAKNTWVEALAWQALAQVKTALGEVNLAINGYLNAVDLAPDQIFPWNDLGRLYILLGQDDKALDSFQRAVKAHPEDPVGWDGLGDVYTRLGQPDEAVAAYQLANVFEKNTKSDGVATLYDKALLLYKETILAGKPGPDTLLSGGEHLVPEKVSNQAEAQMEIPFNETEGCYELTLEQVEQMGLDDPVEENDGQYPPSIVGASIQNNPVQLIENFPLPGSRPTMESNPGSGDLKPARLPVSTENHNLTSPASPAPRFAVDSSAGKREFPKQTLEKSANIAPVQILVDESQVEHEKAVSISVPVEPARPVVLLNPVPQSDKGRVAGTITSYEAVVRENPKNDRAWDSLGNLYRMANRYKEAIHALECAVSLEPNKYVYRYELGTLYAVEKRYEAAIAEMEKVLVLNPAFIFAHCALASYLRKTGKQQQSQSHITIAAPFMAKEKEYDRACFESICGNVEAAVSLLEVAIEKNQTTLEWIRRDSDLDFIRSEALFIQFEEKYLSGSVE